MKLELARPARTIVALLMVLPIAGFADTGGKPNKRSEATTAACLVDDDTVHVYSCKALSNVVLWCNGVYVKHDDIEGEIYDGEFDCSTEGEDEQASGPITMVAIKSGSLRNTTVQGAPPGSGIFIGGLLSCDDPAFVHPLPDECDVEEDPEEPPEESLN
jgi:hypothetical protein